MREFPGFTLAMGKRGYDHFPAWVQTIGSMMAGLDPDHRKVKIRCTGCGSHRSLDRAALATIAERYGGESYSLINQRTRCLRTGCNGWWRPYWQSGVMRPLWDEATVNRWIAEDWAEQRAISAGSR